MIAINKFLSAPLLEKRLFLEAYILLGVMRVAILTISFKRLTSSLDQNQFSRNSKMPQQCKCHQQQVHAIRRAIIRAARRTPWESACLVQALTARVMLQKRHIPGAFYLGVAPDDTGESPLKAHAWSQCGNIIVTGNHGHERFKIMTVFSWNKS